MHAWAFIVLDVLIQNENKKIIKNTCISNGIVI